MSGADPATWGLDYARKLASEAPRRAARWGSVATPPGVARPWIRAAAAHLVADPPRVWDPAAGGGALLVTAARTVWDRHPDWTAAERLAWLRRDVRGDDVDPQAVAVARRALAAAAGVPTADLTEVVRVRDALLHPPPRVDWVVANPPWVEATRHHAADRAHRRAVAARWDTARGAWDLWCPFVALARAAVGEGGVIALLVPDRLASAPYAEASRRALHAHGIVSLERVTADALGVQARGLRLIATPRGPHLHLPSQGPWPIDAAWESLGPHRLGDVAEVCGAATVAEAYAWRALLRDQPPDAAHAPVVNSGTIDPFRSLWGTRPMRYLRGRWTRPVVPVDALGARRAAQARAAKIVVAGLTRHLEVLPDPDGVWVGAKSTTLVLPHDPDDTLWLAAWLDSDRADRAYRDRYGGLAMRGGYLVVGPRQLRDLPVPAPDAAARAALTADARARLADPDDPAIRARIAARFGEGSAPDRPAG